MNKVFTIASPLYGTNTFFGAIIWEIEQGNFYDSILPEHNSFDDLKLPYIDIRLPNRDTSKTLYKKYRYINDNHYNEYMASINSNEKYQQHINAFNEQLSKSNSSLSSNFTLRVNYTASSPSDTKKGRVFKHEKVMLFFRIKTDFDNEDYWYDSDFEPADYKDHDEFYILTRSIHGE